VDSKDIRVYCKYIVWIVKIFVWIVKISCG